RRLLVLEGDRHVLPARSVDRHARRDSRPARPEDGAPRQRRHSPELVLREHVGNDPGDHQPLLGARLLGRRRAVDGNGLRRRGVQRGRGVAVPEAGRRDGCRDRADRRAPKSRRLVAGGSRGAGAAARPLVSWERDDAKLDRVRRLMAERELDAIVARAPDNVLYLTNFWGMKGYDPVVFPRAGEPVCIDLGASVEDAARTAWTTDVKYVRGYDEQDPRPPVARTLALARDAASEYERVGVELSLGTQASDRMVGEPTTYTAAWFDG